MSEKKIIESEAFDWASLPRELPKEFMVKIIAKTPATTYHKKDKPYIRIYSKEELKEAARSLAHNHIDLNHDLKQKIPGAFVVDAQYNEGNVECICYIPNMRVINELKTGEITSVSVEESVRELVETPQGTELHGILFTGLALMENSFLVAFRGHAGDKNTKIELIELTENLFDGMLCEVSEILVSETELGEPFAGYTDFAACVAANKDKGDPEAYCGYIKHKVEDKPKKAEVKEVSLGPTKPLDPDLKPLDLTTECTPECKECKEVQLPEMPVNTMANIQDPVLNLAPQNPLKPETNVVATGVIHNKGFGANATGTPEAGNPLKNLGTPVVTAPAIDASNPKKVEEIPIDKKKMEEMVEAVVEKENDKKRIKELEEAVTRLQTTNTEKDAKFTKSVSEARKQGKDKALEPIKAVLESEKYMSTRYNYSAQVLVNKVKKAIRDAEEK